MHVYKSTNKKLELNRILRDSRMSLLKLKWICTTKYSAIVFLAAEQVEVSLLVQRHACILYVFHQLIQ